MPTPDDWDLLRETISCYTHIITSIWGHITPANAQTLIEKTHMNQNLFQFLFENEHFSEANTVAPFFQIFDDQYIALIADKHNYYYCELLKILCTDIMVLLYEDQFEENSAYRQLISKLYEKMLADSAATSDIFSMLNEFRFLTSINIELFYHKCALEESAQEFTLLYGKYKTLVPLVYRLINEYYLTYIQYLVQTIIDISSNSFIIQSEYYIALAECIRTLPKEYIDNRFLDKAGNNIATYIGMLPELSPDINLEIYQKFFQLNPHMNTANSEGNTIFHIIALYDNILLLTELLLHLKIETIASILSMSNNLGDTCFDIALEKNNFLFIVKLVDYLPSNMCLKITNRIIENFEIVGIINQFAHTDIDVFNRIYAHSISYFLDQLVDMKKNPLYDSLHYDNILNKINVMINQCNKCSLHDSYWDWLDICITINEFNLFQKILDKYGDLQFILNRSDRIPLITHAIDLQRISFIQLLLDNQVDVLMPDQTGRTGLMAALQTKNLHIIRLITPFVPKLSSEAMILSYFDDVVGDNCIFSISGTMSKLFRTIEYWLTILIGKIDYICSHYNYRVLTADSNRKN